MPVFDESIPNRLMHLCRCAGKEIKREKPSMFLDIGCRYGPEAECNRLPCVVDPIRVDDDGLTS